MGTPIIPIVQPWPVRAGDPCSKCWGAGKAFGDKQSPSQVVVRLAKIEKGPAWEVGDGEPLDGEFTLWQHLSYPCHYTFRDFKIYIAWSNIGVGTEVRATNAKGVLCFYRFVGPCATLIISTFNLRFASGSCLITIPEIEE
jgi:hypothetical protein